MEQGLRAVHPRRWTREEYDKMIEAGVFAHGERLELIEGEILQMMTQGSLHATAIQLIQEAFRKAFGSGFVVRNQLPIALDPYSEPEPDISVVPGAARDYRDAHPSTALLIVEVSDQTLSFDRRRKKSIYARAGIREFWVVNPIEGCVEVFRDPEGDDYCSIRQFKSGESITPLAATSAEISTDDLLP
jgi:Uma2 family endonuclease